MSQHIMDRGDSSMQHTNAIKKTLKENAGSQANDACNFFFDYTLPQEERLKKFAEVFQNPYCYQSGNLTVQIGFMEGAPTLQQLLTRFLLRKRDGL